MGVCSSTCGGNAEMAGPKFAHDLEYPMYLLPVSTFMGMAGPPPCHQQLIREGLLVEYTPGMFVIFVSHEWLTKSHPDPEGKQLHTARGAFRAFEEGRLSVDCDIRARVFFSKNQKLHPSMCGLVRSAFIWLDWYAIPQLTALAHESQGGDMKQHFRNAVASIPGYVERSRMFFILTPSMCKENGRACDYDSWKRRGWCRAEQFCKMMAADDGDEQFVLILRSANHAIFAYSLDWILSSPVQGELTVESDREFIREIVRKSLDSRLRCCQAGGHGRGVLKFRFLQAMRRQLIEPELLTQSPPEDEEIENFFVRFACDHDSSASCLGLSDLHCACLESNLSVVHQLLSLRADVNDQMQAAAMEIGVWPGTTTLMLVSLFTGSVPILRALLEARADIHACDKRGLQAFTFAAISDKPETMHFLLSQGANLEHRVSAGGTAVIGVSTHGAAKAMAALLEMKADIAAKNNFGLNALHTVSISGNLEIATLLLGARADPSERGHAQALAPQGARESDSGHPDLLERFIEEAPGITAIGLAFFLGQDSLCRLLLDANAKAEVRNDAGRGALESARQNGFELECFPLARSLLEQA